MFLFLGVLLSMALTGLMLMEIVKVPEMEVNDHIFLAKGKMKTVLECETQEGLFPFISVFLCL